MRKLNWKSLLLVGSVAAIGAAIFLFGIVSTLRLPILGWHGLGSFVVLVVLTVLSSRFTVPVTNVDGTNQTLKSVADTFIFLAVMMYTTVPANSIGPALILAAVVGFISSFSFSERWPTVFAVGISIISTFLASLVYRFMVLTLAGGALDGKEKQKYVELVWRVSARKDRAEATQVLAEPLDSAHKDKLRILLQTSSICCHPRMLQR